MSRRAPCARVMFAFALAAWSSGAQPQESAVIEGKALLERIEKHDPALIILDVRTPAQFAAGHVPGAVNIPFDHLPASIAALASPATKDVVVYCRTGVRAASAIQRLHEHGFTRVLHLEGDFEAWRDSGKPRDKQLTKKNGLEPPAAL